MTIQILGHNKRQNARQTNADGEPTSRTERADGDNTEQIDINRQPKTKRDKERHRGKHRQKEAWTINRGNPYEDRRPNAERRLTAYTKKTAWRKGMKNRMKDRPATNAKRIHEPSTQKTHVHSRRQSVRAMLPKDTAIGAVKRQKRECGENSDAVETRTRQPREESTERIVDRRKSRWTEGE